MERDEVRVAEPGSAHRRPSGGGWNTLPTIAATGIVSVGAMRRWLAGLVAAGDAAPSSARA